jgi:ribosome biogenesis GTPase / thiamine phosphate phosphatase
MAKKGKKGKRIKNWGRRWQGQEHAADASAGSQKVTEKGVKLPNWRQGGDENLQDLPRAEGMFVGHYPGGAVVKLAGEGGARIICGIAGTFRSNNEDTSALAIGDIVTVALTASQHTSDAAQADMVRADGMIVARQPRRTVLARPRPRSGKRHGEYDKIAFDKVIAANMDQLLVVASVREPRTKQTLIDRFLIIAERGELAPVVVINKIDLASPPPEMTEYFDQRGVAYCLCSAVTGEGMARLAELLTGHTSVMAGPSGAGKSTLTNLVVPTANALTQPVRERDSRGRHTTAAAMVYDLPGGGLIVDTPGIRELGVTMEASELPWYFPEFEPFSSACKFHDCTHTHEPHCAVRMAVEEGVISPARFESYLRILEDL